MEPNNSQLSFYDAPLAQQGNFGRAEAEAFQSGVEIDESLMQSMPDWPTQLDEEQKLLIAARTTEKMRVLEKLDALCKQQGVAYFAIGSLLRSAVFFHKTVVPDYEENWSVALLRPDYEKLMAHLRSGASDDTVQLLETIPGTPYPLMIPLLCNRPYFRGDRRLPAGILIYPFDRLPAKDATRQKLWRQTARACRKFDLAIKARDAYKAEKMQQAAYCAAQKYADTDSPYWGRVLRVNGLMARPGDLFPLQQKQMGHLSIPCPANPARWVLHPSPKADPEVLAAINASATEQKLELLHLLDEVCEKHGLQYFAYAKLLQGCVHYAGPIPGDAIGPWDLALPRKDYEQLLTLLEAMTLPEGYSLERYLEDTSLPAPLVVLQKMGTFSFEGITLTRPFRIILAPFDQVPDGYDHFCGFVRRMRRLNNNYKKLVWVQKRPQPKNMTDKFFWYQLRFGWRSGEKAFARLNRIASKYAGKPYANHYSRMVPSRSKLTEAEQLFPVERRPFLNGTLPCPRDINPWTSVMDEELTNQITQIQRADLGLLQEFDAVCQKLGIGYFVCGGTMLGYMRHGGFIPWDDDIDVGMLRADYNRFLAEAGPLLSDKVFLQTRQSDPTIPYLFSKLRLNNTEYVTKYNALRPFHKGICLDLFPFDAIPDDPVELRAFRKEVRKKVRLHNRCANKAEAEPINEKGPVNLEELWLRTIGFLHRAFYRCVPLKITQKAYIKVATRYNSTAKARGLSSVASFVPSYTHICLEDLLPYQRVTFSGVDTYVPAKPEVFLTMQYGDFMQMPPLHMQAGHPLIRWSVDVEADKAKAAQQTAQGE